MLQILRDTTSHGNPVNSVLQVQFPTTYSSASSPIAGNIIDYRNHSGGVIVIPATSTNTSITWYGSVDGKNFYALYDGTGSAGAGNAVISALYDNSGSGAAIAVKIPDACFGCPFLAGVVNAAQMNATVCLKS